MFHPIFLTVVFVVRNESSTVGELVKKASNILASLVSDYELVLVDNASNDDTVARLRELTGESGEPNLQVYALGKEVDMDTASWVGLENALGDFVAVIDPRLDDIGFLPQMLEKAVAGTDVVFTRNTRKPRYGLIYGLIYKVFYRLLKFFSGVHITREAPQYRLLSKAVVNFVLQHPQPATTYRYLPATGGYIKEYLEYSFEPRPVEKKKLREGLDRGMRLLVSTTRAPMRLVTILCLFGAFSNLLYSVYVLAIRFFSDNFTPGWASLSLQQSGMFFLISLVLWILSEYIVQLASLNGEGPPYHIRQEFTSARMTRKEKLNVEESTALPADRNEKLPA